MKIIDLSRDMLVKEAERIAKLAGAYLEQKFYGGFTTQNKGPKDIVTEADYGSEKIILSEIQSLFPYHSILAEESGQNNKNSQYQWVIDPLDGTVNFSYGIPIFGVIISIVEKGDPIIGVHHMPILKETYTTIRGQGAFMNGKKIQVSQRSEISEMIIGLGDFNCGASQELRKNNNSKLRKIIENFSADTLRTKMMGAACVDLAFIASGKLDILFYPTSNPNPWDVLAGQLLIEEAGGKTVVVNGITVFFSGKKEELIMKALEAVTL